MTRALLDTSVFIADEQDRPLADPPGEVAVSAVTLAELELGVLTARDAAVRATRLATLTGVRDRLTALPVDQRVASAFAALVATLREEGRTIRVQDGWIAATAIAHGAAVCTQDADFDGIQGLEVVRV